MIFSPDTTGGALYDSNTVVTITPVPDSGFVFNGWSGDLSGNADPDRLMAPLQNAGIPIREENFVMSTGNGIVAWELTSRDATANDLSGTGNNGTVITVTADGQEMNIDDT